MDDSICSEAQIVPGTDPLPVLGGQDVLGAVVGKLGEVEGAECFSGRHLC